MREFLLLKHEWSDPYFMVIIRPSYHHSERVNNSSLWLSYSPRRHILVRHRAGGAVEAGCDIAVSKCGQTRALGYLEAVGSDCQTVRQGVPSSWRLPADRRPS